MTGKLRIGTIVTGIETVTFAEGIMRLTATLGPDVSGPVGGMLAIEGEDGTVCWRGAKVHDYGTKPAGGASTWHLTLDADLVDRTSVRITATWDGPAAQA